MIYSSFSFSISIQLHYLLCMQALMLCIYKYIIKYFVSDHEWAGRHTHAQIILLKCTSIGVYSCTNPFILLKTIYIKVLNINNKNDEKSVKATNLLFKKELKLYTIQIHTKYMSCVCVCTFIYNIKF